MFNLLIFLIFLLTGIVSSCKKEAAPVSSIDAVQVLPTNDQLRKIDIIQTDYDSLLVQNSPNMFIKSRSIQRVDLYKFDGMHYVLAQTYSPEYSGSYGSYHPNFKFRLKVKKTVLFYKFRLKYFLFNSSTLEIDTSATMCKYPYNTAEVYRTFADLPLPEDKKMRFAEDIDFEDGKFYYRNGGGYGIYEIDENSGNYRTLVEIVAHDYIAVDSSYLYYTTGPSEICKINISNLNNSEFLHFKRGPMGEDSTIFGMEAENGKIYILTLGGPTGDYLLEFDSDANFLRSYPYPAKTLALTKYGDRLYSVDSYHSKIKVYNLKTQKMEPDLLIPSKDTFAIRIKNGFFYYSEFKKKYIGKIPLEDIIR